MAIGEGAYRPSSPHLLFTNFTFFIFSLLSPPMAMAYP